MSSGSSGNDAWCLCGDFNEVRCEDDRKNTQFQSKEADEFNDFINLTQLLEIPMGVFNTWLEEAYIRQIVTNAWSKEVKGSRPDCVFRDKLKNVKAALKEWSKVRFGALDNCIETHRKNAMKWELEAESHDLEEVRCQNGLRQGGHGLTKIEKRFVCSNKKQEVAKMSDVQAAFLELAIEENEAWEAVWSCGSDKAPGPDGFNFKYIKKLWDIFKRDLVVALRWFWEKMEVSKGCNASFVMLIPKVNDPIGLKDFRPISLIGCYHKIVSKIMAERVKKVIGNVVGEVQNAFIQGRFISDGILIANETVEYMRKKKKRGLILKFGDRWCRRVEACLTSSSMSILVNGSPTNEFRIEKGVRQGDPLSHFLCIVAAEGLNAIVQEAITKGIFKGVLVGKDEVRVIRSIHGGDVGLTGGEGFLEIVITRGVWNDIVRVGHDIDEVDRCNEAKVADRGDWVNGGMDMGMGLGEGTTRCTPSEDNKFTVKSLARVVDEKRLQ
ncbi:cysteine-rich receptor-like protein kinase [Tanacetum coccineum]